MKICYFDDFKLGIVKGDNVVDVSAVVQDIPHTGPHNLISGLIEHFDAYRGKLEAAVAAGTGVPLKSVRLRSPLPRPYNIDCMAVNYMEDGTRSEPAPINAFHKSPSGVIGDGDTMILEDIPATIFEGEAELALVIGKRASKVKAADAMQYIFGYVNFIDGSARGLPPPTNVFYQMKSRDTYAPMGPFLVTADQRSAENAGHAQGQRYRQTEFQHRRHGAQDSALHRVGELYPHFGAGRCAGHRHQSPRSEPIHGRR